MGTTSYICRAQWADREEDGEEEEEAVGESEDELSLTFSEVPRLPSLSSVVWYITLLHDGVNAQQVWSVRKGWPLRLTLGRPGSPRNLLSHLFFSLRKTKHQSSSALRVAVRSAWRSLPSLARSTLGQRQLQKCSWNLCLHVHVLVGEIWKGTLLSVRTPTWVALEAFVLYWILRNSSSWDPPGWLWRWQRERRQHQSKFWVSVNHHRHGCYQICSTFSYYSLQWKSWFKARSSSGWRETSHSHKEVPSMNNNITNIDNIQEWQWKTVLPTTRTATAWSLSLFLPISL